MLNTTMSWDSVGEWKGEEEVLRGRGILSRGVGGRGGVLRGRGTPHKTGYI